MNLAEFLSFVRRSRDAYDFFLKFLFTFKPTEVVTSLGKTITLLEIRIIPEFGRWPSYRFDFLGRTEDDIETYVSLDDILGIVENDE